MLKISKFISDQNTENKLSPLKLADNIKRISLNS